MKVSIICTNYNKGDWVREAMDSFLNQKTNFDFEIIIIDDASTDHSYELTARTSSRIRTSPCALIATEKAKRTCIPDE